MYIPEADFEHLIRTLSEARSRATELAASISARLGTEHRLAELANAASWKIENMLREVRTSATQNPETAGGLAELQGALQTETQPVTPTTVNPSEHIPTGTQAMAAFAAQAGLEPEHWLPMFVNDLTSQLRTSGGVTFEVAERLLQQRKDDFLRDFLIARRMYRTYPHLFPEIQGHMGPRKARRFHNEVFAMIIDARELNDLTRRATDLMSETADVPRVLRNRLGEQHQLAQAAEEMQGSIENFVRELRCFDVSAQIVEADTFEGS